nr:hypothetical protein GSWITJQO_GSWITJQO_CDS_0003 [Microvirus sp.]CAI9752499.1 hypothetical protein XTAFSSYH_XTAFSSYH_CDS_0003 [Microvirus sp.]
MTNKINIATAAAEDIIKYLQKYLIEEENFNVYLSDKDMNKINNLINYIWEKLTNYEI